MTTGILDRGALGRFTSLEPLGAGGMGIVLAAYDPQLDRRVAIKVLRTRGITPERREKEAARLLREAKAMAQLSHPNVVTVFEAGTVDEHVFIAMEYVAGRTLRRWLNERKRTVAEIIDVFVKAGRGLAAGHAAGLVHRDFKPDNVLVGDDGRVRVIDFGLARGVLDATDEPDLRTKPMDVHSPLTTVGSMSGTPAYMAPEQHERGTPQLDARTDQFAFCVSLFEALHGRLPYEGETMIELVANISLGNMRAIAPRADISARVNQALMRGLETKPADRFPSMTALLDQLEPPAPRRSRTGVAIAAVVAAAAAVAIVVLATRKPAATCSSGEDRLAGVWDGAIKERAQQAFAKSGRSHATATFTRVGTQLDAYTTSWLGHRKQICDARARKERTETAFDLGMRCLDQRLDELSALTKLFASDADPVLVDRAVGAVQQLPSSAQCLDVAAGPTLDATKRSAVEAIRRDAAAARAYHSAGKSAIAYERVKPLLERAKTLDYPPLAAELYFLAGQTLSGAAKAADAEAALREAAGHAAHVKDDLLLARSWMWLVWVIGFQQARHAEAIMLQTVAEAAIDRADGSDALRGDLAFYIASVHFQRGEYDRARADYDRSLAIRTKTLGAEHPDVAQVHNSLGGTMLRKGELDAATQHFEKAIAIFEATLGPNHPDVGRPLSNLAAVAQMRKKLDDATRYLERAVKIFEEVNGPDHPNVGLAVNNLGGLARDRKDCAAGVPHFTRALAILEKQGATHPYVAYPLIGRAQCLVDLRKPADAIADAERAIAILAAQAGDPTHLAEARYALARGLWDANRERPRARTLAREAREAFAKAGPPAAEQLAEIDGWLAQH